MPVYSWLESLDTDEVVKSNQISDWLTANQHILQHLSSRHSRYHLMHYIKKCHVKILKRQGKIVFPQVADKSSSVKVAKNAEAKAVVPLQYFGGNNVNNIPKDSELYKAKHSEAVQKYEILVEFEKQLSTLFSHPVQN
ncbi:hypothetical protein Leryth_001961 [Lithospermum erythrorhizon]|nr:hypothetical protein Leryth_001961 [Lithospermum erythrorhizon]